MSQDDSTTCLFWGALPGWQRGAGHLNCDVVLTKKNLRGVCSRKETAEFVRQIETGEAEVLICGCECTTCKRARVADGRPLVRDGRIVREVTR